MAEAVQYLAEVPGGIARDRARLHLVGKAEADQIPGQHFRELIDSLDAIIWEADAATFRPTFVSRRAADLGYPLDRWVASPELWATLIHPDDFAPVTALRQKAVHERQDLTLEYRVVAADGRVIWFRDSMSVVLGADRQVRYLRGLMKDVTHERRAEAAVMEVNQRLRNALALVTGQERTLDDQTALRSTVAQLELRVDERSAELRDAVAALEQQIAERRRAEADRTRLAEAVERERATLATALDSIGDGLVVLGADGCVRYCNAHVGDFFGVDPQTALGRRLAALLARLPLPPEKRAELAHTWQQVLRHPERQCSMDIELPGPPRRDLHVRLFPVVDIVRGGTGCGILVHDATTEREAERAKDAFISMISHELRSPLGLIKGYATTLLLPDAPDDEATQQRCLQTIDETCDELSDLVDNLLDASRLRAGTFAIEQRPVALAPLVRVVVDRLCLAERADRLRATLPRSLPPVLADSRRVEQVIRNLLENALKYSPPTAPVRLTAARRRHEIVVSVADEGAGIPAAEQARLFRAFERGRGAHTTRVRGTGLGLAIVKGIVEAHDGRLWVESPAPGREGRARPGTVVHFTLPIAEPGRRHVHQGRAPSARARNTLGHVALTPEGRHRRGTGQGA